MAIKTFTTGEVLTASDTNTYLANAGLVYVAETNFSTAGTPFINGCFSSTYQNYRIVISTTSSVAGTTIRFRLRSGTSTPETAAVYDHFGFSYVGTLASEINANQTQGKIGDVFNGAAMRTVCNFDLFNANTATETHTLPLTWGSQTGTVYFVPIRLETTTQYTGIEIYADSGTLTGSMRVYGYRQA